MFCPNCGFDNLESAKFCQKCGHALSSFNTGKVDSLTQTNHESTNKSKLIILISLIIIVVVIICTLYSTYDSFTDPNNNGLKVYEAMFYTSGNTIDGVTATINVGSEHAGETIEAMTTYYRDGKILNNDSHYGYYKVDPAGYIKITEYYLDNFPDYCHIKISYDNKTSQYGCNLEIYRGSQTTTPSFLNNNV